MRSKILNLDQVRLIKTLFTLVLIAIFAYVYLVGLVVFNTAKRTELSSAVSIMQSEVGNLENRYLADREQINRDLAAVYGLSESSAENSLVVNIQTVGLTINE